VQAAALTWAMPKTSATISDSAKAILAIRVAISLMALMLSPARAAAWSRGANMLAASLSQNSFAAFAWSGCAADASASPARIAPGHVRAGISGVNAALCSSPNGS